MRTDRRERSMSVGTVLLVILMLGGLAGMAAAQPKQLQPGSTLVFPFYETAAGFDTVLTVTNLNEDRTPCGDSSYREGDIFVEFRYVDASDGNEFTRFEPLTPGDTLSVLVSHHNPFYDRGFVILTAVDPNDWFRRIAFDDLVGAAIVFDGEENRTSEYTPYVFDAIPDSSGNCTALSTDLDGDGALDFDGAEYVTFPGELVVDRFFEEGPGTSNQLTLLSTAPAGYVSQIDLVFVNNRGQEFTRAFSFNAWWTGRLSEISNIATQLGGDSDEVLPVETGWVLMSGRRILDLAGNPVDDENGDPAKPPVLGIFTQFARGLVMTTPLHFDGSLDGLEFPLGDGDPQQGN